MKKILTVCLILCLFLCGCTATTTDNGDSNEVPTIDYDNVNFDLTQISENQAYNFIYNPLSDPESYIGAAVKMSDKFMVSEYNGKYYYMCAVENHSGESIQALEFIPLDNLSYPDDFPPVDSEITVTGQFATYSEGSSLYATLKFAKIEY